MYWPSAPALQPRVELSGPVTGAVGARPGFDALPHFSLLGTGIKPTNAPGTNPPSLLLTVPVSVSSGGISARGATAIASSATSTITVTGSKPGAAIRTLWMPGPRPAMTYDPCGPIAAEADDRPSTEAVPSVTGWPVATSTTAPVICARVSLAGATGGIWTVGTATARPGGTFVSTTSLW